jgi:uncharacterized protein YbjT (DUF2867 family)
MITRNKTITIFGGTGFLGRTLLRSLLKNPSYKIIVVSRRAKLPREFAEFIANGVIKIIKENLENVSNIESEIKSSDAVLNLGGILFEKNKGDFFNIHVEAAKNIALIAKRNKIATLIHISALGVDRAITSEYAKTKLQGESEVLNIFPQAIIIRPSVIFGTEDNFYNQFARMAKYSLFLPLIGGGNTKFQPVYVGDVALAILTVLETSTTGIYELAGSKIYTFKEILCYILKTINKKRMLLPISFKIAKVIGLMAQCLPRPLITRDQVELLQYDNVMLGNHPGLLALGIMPTSIEEIVPTYLIKE